MREIAQDEIELGISDDFYLEQTNKDIIDKLHSISLERKSRYENRHFCFFIYVLNMEIIRILTPFMAFLSYGSILILTFMNTLKLHNDFATAISISLITGLWVAVIYSFMSVIRFMSYSISLHRTFFSKVIFLKYMQTGYWIIFEFIVYSIILIACVVSLSTFNDQCLKNYEDCKHIWKLLRIIFFNNN